MFKKHRRKFHFSRYRQKTRRRIPERKRGLFKKKRTSPSPKVYLSTPRFKAREASGSVQRKVFLFLFILASGSLFYLLFFFPFWEIKEVNIIGSQLVSQEEVDDIVEDVIGGKILFIFSKRNLILTPKKEIRDKILNHFAQIQSIEMKKEFPDVLKIKIFERAPVAIWATGASQDLFLPREASASDTAPYEEGKEMSAGEKEEQQENKTRELPTAPSPPEDVQVSYYFLNQEGILGDEILADQIFDYDLPIIYDQSFSKVGFKEKIVASEFLEFLFLVRDLLSLKTNLKIQEFIVPIPDSHDLYVKMDKGYQIFFDTAQPLQGQLDTLVMVLREDIEKNKKEVKYYIDLRVEGMAYYK